MFFNYEGVIYDSLKLESKRDIAKRFFISKFENEDFIEVSDSLFFNVASLLFFEVNVIPLEKSSFFGFSF